MSDKDELTAEVEEFFNHAHGKGGRFTSGGGSSSGGGGGSHEKQVADFLKKNPSGRNEALIKKLSEKPVAPKARGKLKDRLVAKHTEKVRSSVTKAIDAKIKGNKQDLQDTENGGLNLRVSASRPKGHTIFPAQRGEFRREARSAIHGFEKMKQAASKASLKELKDIQSHI